LTLYVEKIFHLKARLQNRVFCKDWGSLIKKIKRKTMDSKTEKEKLFKIQNYLENALGNALPKDVYLQVTERCNCRCTMCDIWKLKRKTPSLIELVAIVRALKEKNTRWITLWGGEPFLHPSILEIMKEVKDCDMKLQIITNGTLLTGERLDATHQYADNVVFSIDSPYEKIHDEIRGRQGTFSSAVTNIKEFVQLCKKTQKGPNIEFDTTILAKNIDHIEEMIGFSQSFGDILVDYDPAQINGTGNNHDESNVNISSEEVENKINQLITLAERGAHITSPEKLKLIKKYLLKQPINEACYSIFKDLLISPSGNVYFCWGIDQVVGNILDSDIEEKWKNAISKNIGVIMGNTQRCQSCGFSHSRWPDPGYKEIIEGINKIRASLF
jgi:MoaA/NifB/PqqE/SkfB family radical SAM enzyme